MFAPDAMAYDFDKPESEPSLAEMSKKAIELLSKDKDGFFLMIEGSKTDWAAHANDPVGVVSEILAFDDAVKVALDFAKGREDTMVLILPDHGTGGITIGNSFTDKSYSSEAVETFVAPLKKAKLTGEGVSKKFDENRTNIRQVVKDYFGIEDLSDTEFAAIKNSDPKDMNSVLGPIISKRAKIGWTTHGHTGEDVVLFTYLPKNGRIVGVIDNTDIAKIISGTWKLSLPKSMTR